MPTSELDPRDEPGPRIGLLRDVEAEPSTHFLQRVRRKIHRRSTVSQLVAYSWHLPGTVLLELAGVLSHMGKALGREKKE